VRAPPTLAFWAPLFMPAPVVVAGLVLQPVVAFPVLWVVCGGWVLDVGLVRNDAFGEHIDCWSEHIEIEIEGAALPALFACAVPWSCTQTQD